LEDFEGFRREADIARSYFVPSANRIMKRIKDDFKEAGMDQFINRSEMRELSKILQTKI